MIKGIKEKITGAAGSITGITSIAGSWQVCHNICLGIIALLGAIGIAVTGMPLIFLTRLAVPFWIIAFVLLSITTGLYIKKKCISKKLLIFNSGLVIAGIPFEALQKFKIVFWAIGGLFAAASLYLFVLDKAGSTKRDKRKGIKIGDMKKGKNEKNRGKERRMAKKGKGV